MAFTAFIAFLTVVIFAGLCVVVMAFLFFAAFVTFARLLAFIAFMTVVIFAGLLVRFMAFIAFMTVVVFLALCVAFMAFMARFDFMLFMGIPEHWFTPDGSELAFEANGIDRLSPKCY